MQSCDSYHAKEESSHLQVPVVGAAVQIGIHPDLLYDQVPSLDPLGPLSRLVRVLDRLPVAPLLSLRRRDQGALRLLPLLLIVIVSVILAGVCLLWSSPAAALSPPSAGHPDGHGHQREQEAKAHAWGEQQRRHLWMLCEHKWQWLSFSHVSAPANTFLFQVFTSDVSVGQEGAAHHGSWLLRPLWLFQDRQLHVSLGSSCKKAQQCEWQDPCMRFLFNHKTQTIRMKRFMASRSGWNIFHFWLQQSNILQNRLALFSWE